jgi:uncharacterized repeat protein (TIGR01451 family)
MVAVGIGLALVAPAAAVTNEESPDTTTFMSSTVVPTSTPATNTTAEPTSETTSSSPPTSSGPPSIEPSAGLSTTAAPSSGPAEPSATEVQPETGTAPVVEPREREAAVAQAAADLSVTQFAPEAAAAGAPITWTLTISNNGPGAVASYTLTDSIPAGVTGVASSTPGCSVAGNLVTCTGGPLGAGNQTVVTITGTTPSPFTFPLVNTATVVGQGGPDADLDNNTSTVVTTTAVPDPQLGLVAQATVQDGNGNGVGDVGETIQYTVQVSNTGNVTLSDLAVEHDGASVACADTVLSLDESTTCSAPAHVITAADVEAGEVVTITTATATAPSGAPVTAPESRTNVPVFEPNPLLALVKDAQLADTNDNDLADLGEAIDYTFTVTNVGNVPLVAMAIVDGSLGGVTCPQTSMAPNDVVICTGDAPHITTAADIAEGQVVNSAFAGATAPGGAQVVSPVSVVNTPTVTDLPGLALDKVAELIDENGNQLADLGERIRWTFLVVNNGSVRLTDVSVDDPDAGTVTCASTTLEVQAATTCEATATHVVTEEDILAGEVDNSAVARALTDPNESPVVSDPDSTVTPTVAVNPGLALEKSAELNDLNDNDLADTGETIDYTFLLTNTGNVTLTEIEVDDPKAGEVTCPSTTLAPGASTTCTAEPYTVTEADIDAGVVRNTAVASGQPPGTAPPVTTPPAMAEVPVNDSGSGENPNEGDASAIALTKHSALSDEDGDGLADAGETVTYTFTVTNTGNTTLLDVTVDDPKVGAVTCPSTALAPGTSMTCTAQPYAVTHDDIATGRVYNVATATGVPEGGSDPVTSPPSSVSLPVDDEAGGGGAGPGLAYSGGGPIGAVMGWVLLLIALGMLLCLASRRPRDEQQN